MSRALFIIVLVVFVAILATPTPIVSVDAQGTGCYIGADVVVIDEVNITIWIHIHTSESGVHHLKVEGAFTGFKQEFDYSYDADSPPFFYLVAYSVSPDYYLVTNATPAGDGCMTIAVVGDPSSITPPGQPVQMPNGGPSNYCYDVEYSLQGDQLVVTGHIAGEGLDRGIVDWGEESTALEFPNGDYFEVSHLKPDTTISVVLESGQVCSQAHFGPDGIIKDW